MGQVPSAWNALPPLLHLANSYSSFKTHLERHLLQEVFPDFPGCGSLLLCAPLYPVFPFLSQQPAFSLWLSLSEFVAPQQTVSSLRAGSGVVCLSVPCAAPA